MGTLAICPWSWARSSARAAAGARTRETARPASAPRQDRDDSPLVHGAAADALVLAASPIREAPAGRGVVAVVLDDGTVLTGTGRTPARRWANGSVSGRDWTLWWERRALEEA